MIYRPAPEERPETQIRFAENIAPSRLSIETDQVLFI